jgi:hypothetical protein
MNGIIFAELYDFRDDQLHGTASRLTSEYDDQLHGTALRLTSEYDDQLHGTAL